MYYLIESSYYSQSPHEEVDSDHLSVSGSVWPGTQVCVTSFNVLWGMEFGQSLLPHGD